MPELSHEDALSALKDARAEAARYRTELRSVQAELETANTQLADLQQTTQDAEQKRTQEDRDRRLRESTDLPLWAIRANTDDIDSLFTDDGSVDAERLSALEASIRADLPSRVQGRVMSGASGRDTKSARTEPNWSDIIGPQN
ncbi:hypothetical protein D7316_02247 [Gordonia insulae]|uniref:Chromosome partition protein Smc n=1 Tax=Gordonia insulae TaxID=2420509 RepID=A0A3G8JKP0_9ACTN|nr:hypothetical protein D7316_02247 [Gordonia insulae]